MAVPSGDPGDLLVTDGTESILLLPEVAQPPPPFESGFHLHVETFFKIRFPSRIVGVGLCTDFRVPLNADGGGRQQSDHFHLPFLTLENASENPTIGSFIRKVFVFHPSARFVSMSSACPFPNRLEDGMVNGLEDRRTHHMAVIECPPTDLWVEFGYQFPCGQVAAFFDTRSDLPKKGLDVLLRKRNPQVVKPRQHLLGTRHERIEQILGLALLAPTFPLSWGRGGWWRLRGIASSQNLAHSESYIPL
jgi:hypothetical protein